MLQNPFFPLPYPPGFEPPQLSLKFMVLSVLFMAVTLFVAVCLAAVQAEKERMKKTTGTASGRLKE